MANLGKVMSLMTQAAGQAQAQVMLRMIEACQASAYTDPVLLALFGALDLVSVKPISSHGNGPTNARP